MLAAALHGHSWALLRASNTAVGNLDSTATSEAIRAEFSKCAGGAGCSAVSGGALASAPLLLPQCCCLCVLATCCYQCSCFDHLQLTGPPAWNPHLHRFGPLLQWQVAPPKLPGSSNLRYAIVSFRKLQDAQAAFDALNKQVGVGGSALFCFISGFDEHSEDTVAFDCRGCEQPGQAASLFRSNLAQRLPGCTP